MLVSYEIADCLDKANLSLAQSLKAVMTKEVMTDSIFREHLQEKGVVQFLMNQLTFYVLDDEKCKLLKDVMHKVLDSHVETEYRKLIKIYATENGEGMLK